MRPQWLFNPRSLAVAANPMMSRSLKMLGVATALALPASLAAVVMGTGTLIPLGLSPGSEHSGQGEPQPAPVPTGEVVQQFAADATQGRGILDLRVFHGPVHLAAWDKAAYEITVFVTPKGSGPGVGDDVVIEADLKDTSTDEVLSLALTVTAAYPPAFTINGRDAEAFVVAKVPRILYERVYVCSGTNGESPFDGIDWWPLGDEEMPPVVSDCIPGSGDLGLHGSIDVQQDSPPEPEVPFLIEGLHGIELKVWSQYGDFDVMGARFDAAELLARYGDVSAEIDAPKLVAITNHGDVTLAGAFDAVDAVTEYGEVTVAASPGSSGALNLLTRYGEVDLTVPKGAGRGYSVEAFTDYGEITIALDGAEATEEASSQWQPTDIVEKLTKFIQGSQDYEKHASASTEDFENAGIQTTVVAATRYGDIVVAHEALEEEEEDE